MSSKVAGKALPAGCAPARSLLDLSELARRSRRNSRGLRCEAAPGVAVRSINLPGANRCGAYRARHRPADQSCSSSSVWPKRSP